MEGIKENCHTLCQQKQNACLCSCACVCQVSGITCLLHLKLCQSTMSRTCHLKRLNLVLNLYQLGRMMNNMQKTLNCRSIFLLCDALHIEERGVFLSILTPTPSHFPVLLLRQQQSKVFAHTFMFSSCSFWHGMHPELV